MLKISKRDMLEKFPIDIFLHSQLCVIQDFKKRFHVSIWNSCIQNPSNWNYSHLSVLFTLEHSPFSLFLHTERIKSLEVIIEVKTFNSIIQWTLIMSDNGSCPHLLLHVHQILQRTCESVRADTGTVCWDKMSARIMISSGFNILLFHCSNTRCFLDDL